jgi:hypothetical protein
VVEQHRDVVTPVDIRAHPQPLRRKRRGMQPKAIQQQATEPLQNTAYPE